MANCSACNDEIGQGAPWLKYRNIILCSNCYINLIPRIYKMKGADDGGLIEILYQECVKVTHNIRYKKTSFTFQNWTKESQKFLNFL